MMSGCSEIPNNQFCIEFFIFKYVLKSLSRWAVKFSQLGSKKSP